MRGEYDEVGGGEGEEDGLALPVGEEGAEAAVGEDEGVGHFINIKYWVY